MSSSLRVDCHLTEDPRPHDLQEGFTAKKSTSTSTRLAAKWNESVRELFQRRQPAEVVTWQVLMRAGALPFQYH
jgi:hypothetical protein